MYQPLLNLELEDQSPPPSWSNAFRFHGVGALLTLFALGISELTERWHEGRLFNPACNITAQATSDMSVAPVIVCPASDLVPGK